MSDWLIAPLLSERLRLRPWEEDDERAIVALKMDSKVRKYLGGPLAADKAVAGMRRQIAAQHCGNFTVAIRDYEDAMGPFPSTASADRGSYPYGCVGISGAVD